MTLINQGIHTAKHNQRLASYFVSLFIIVAALALGACASSKARNTESLLSAAGFHTLTPSTPQQQQIYASMPASEVQRLEVNGKVVYAYADKKAGIVYVGSETEYQKFKQLGLQQKMADQQLQAAQMNQDAAMNWGSWGPRGMWW